MRVPLWSLKVLMSAAPEKLLQANVSRASIFAGLSSDDISALSEDLIPVDFPCGHTVFSQGQSARRIYIINSGKVKVARVTAAGCTQLIDVLGPTDVFGELAVIDEAPRGFTVITLTNVRGASIDRATLKNWMIKRPEIAFQLLQLLSRRLRRTAEMMSAQIFVDVRGRVARQILYLAQRFGTSEGNLLRIDHELTQSELAQFSGATRETVNVILVDFAQQGWIRTSGKSFFLYDLDQLALHCR